MTDTIDTQRLRELSTRLVASGPKAAHVSASECHEICEGMHAALNEVERLRAALREACEIGRMHADDNCDYNDVAKLATLLAEGTP